MNCVGIDTCKDSDSDSSVRLQMGQRDENSYLRGSLIEKVGN